MGGLDFELPSVVPAGLCAYAFSRDVPPETLFAATGLSPEVLGDPERPIRASVMLPLWRFLLDRFPDEPITLELAERMDFDFLGLAGQLIRHSPTVRAAIERTMRFQRLYDPGLFTTFHEADGRAVYGIGHVDEVRALGAPVEMMVAVSVHYLRQLVEAYARHFGGPVRFGQPRTLLVMDAKVLDRPVIGADPSVLRYLSAHAEGLLASRPESDAELPLADGVRREVALRLLANESTPIQEVAFVIGYQDVPSFYRAFKRWTGKTPAEVRRAQARLA